MEWFLPNPQDLSPMVRKTVQVLMYNHAWSLLWYLQMLMTFVERRRQDAKATAWILSSVTAAAGAQIGDSWSCCSLLLLMEDLVDGSPHSQDTGGCWHSLWEQAEPRLYALASCSCPWPSSCTSLGATGTLCWLLGVCDTLRPQEWGWAEGQQEILEFLDTRAWKRPHSDTVSMDASCGWPDLKYLKS